MTTSIEAIQRIVAEKLGIHVDLIVGPRRDKSITYARHVAMYLVRKKTNASYPEIGRAFGNRDHTTVMSAIRKIERLRMDTIDHSTWMLTESLDSAIQVWTPTKTVARVPGEGVWVA